MAKCGSKSKEKSSEKSMPMVKKSTVVKKPKKK